MGGGNMREWIDAFPWIGERCFKKSFSFSHGLGFTKRGRVFGS
jgi:hypothetical protein